MYSSTRDLQCELSGKHAVRFLVRRGASLEEVSQKSCRKSSAKTFVRFEEKCLFKTHQPHPVVRMLAENLHCNTV